MADTMTDEQRTAFLTSLGLDTDASALVDESAPAKATTTGAIAPPDVNPHTMPASEIVFDERLLDDFPDLTGDGLKRASAIVFSLYKSPGRDKERHSLLHRRITEFIGATRRSRATGGYVKETIKATKEQRDLAAVLAATGLLTADLVALLQDSQSAGTTQD